MIKINYDTLGKPANIYIQINEIWALVPYNPQTKQIDWDSIDYEPTRNSIQSAWEEWSQDKDIAQELRDRPDLAPQQPKPQPQWGQFNLALMVLPAYNNLMTQVPGYLAGNLSVVAGQFATGDFSNYDSLKYLWDLIVNTATNKPNTSDISSLNQLAQSCNMRFSFGSDGKLVLL